MKITILSALVVLATSCVICHGLTLYPYGTGIDEELMTAANPAVTIDATENFYFYGKDYKHICLSDNGFLSFGGPVASNSPKLFPVTSGSLSIQQAAFIAPFWSDVDTRCGGGKIYYRTTTDSTLLEELRTHIMMSKDPTPGFSPKEAVIATWVDVSPSFQTCDRSKPGEEKQNTFQIALVTDGVSETYAIFRYHKLEWHSSSYRGPATAGLNKGDVKTGLNLLPLSLLADRTKILELTMRSNIEYGGIYIYHLNLMPSMQAQVRLMANMMLLEQVGETAEVAEAELYSPNEDLHISKHFRNSRPDALTADVEPKERYNNYGAGRASRPYIQRARDEEVNALSHELQDIKY